MVGSSNAFIVTLTRLPVGTGQSFFHRRAPCCGLEGKFAEIAVRKACAAAAALLLVSQPTIHHVHAMDNVLVFDHDQTLVGANFAGRMDLEGSIFTKSNCTRANFAGANLKNAQLDDTNLIEAVLDDAGKMNAVSKLHRFARPHID
jgi:Pentapeptide repeats (8 copies)